MTIAIEQTADLAACHAIRRDVFVLEQQVPDAEEWDELDAEALHFLLYEEKIPVGTARIRLIKNTAKLERIALHKAARGKGYGEQLMQHLLAVATAHPAMEYAMLNAQTQAIPFYEKLGFRTCSDIFMDASIPHRQMQLPLR